MQLEEDMDGKQALVASTFICSKIKKKGPGMSNEEAVKVEFAGYWVRRWDCHVWDSDKQDESRVSGKHPPSKGLRRKAALFHFHVVVDGWGWNGTLLVLNRW